LNNTGAVGKGVSLDFRGFWRDIDDAAAGRNRMRVIAGKFKGRKLVCPPGLAVRPTSDPVRETIFNLLAGEIEESRVVDLFAGVGALGIEALSRGARSALFVELSREAGRYLSRNLETVGAGEEARVMKGDVFQCVQRLSGRGQEYDLGFADPPYGGGFVSRLLALEKEFPLLERGGTFVLQHHVKEPAREEGPRLELYKRREFGDTLVSLYHVK
jgi:16S rRNA (guanine966-N2)-methyltransferase